MRSALIDDLFEVRAIQLSYAKPLDREAIVQSVKEQAADLVCFLGPNATVEKIISKLETAYGTISGYDALDATFLWGCIWKRLRKFKAIPLGWKDL